MLSTLAVLALACLPATVAADPPPVFAMGFDGTIQTALAASSALKAAGAEAEASRARAGGAAGGMLPTIVVDGTYRYLAEVPSLRVFPGKPPVDLGAHDNYSLGPTVNWTVWDWGTSYETWRGARDRADAEAAQRDLVRRQVALGAAMTYIQAQMAAEQVRLLANAVKVATAQHHDISLRQSSGASSRLEALQAHQELLARQRGFAQARADLAAALQDLFVLTATGTGLDASAPVDASVTGELPPAAAPATLLVRLDPLDAALASLGRGAEAGPDPAYPRIRYFDRLQDAAHRAAAGVSLSRLPKVQVTGRISLDYPNGPVLEQVTQKTAGLAVSMPIFTGTRLVREAAEQRRHAAAFEAQREAAKSDLARDWSKATARYRLLRAQDDLNRQAAAEATETARLVYASFRGGQARFIEVETANLHTLEAQVQEARTKAEMLTQLAIMHSLSKEEL